MKIVYLDENPYIKWSTRSPKVAEFEKAMSDYLGVKDCVAVNSGTSALHLALLACRIGPGCEVILPVLTFIATANAVSYTGSTPVFVDVDPETWCMTDTTMKEGLNYGATEAAIPVDLYGNPSIINPMSVYSVTDASESLGSEVDYIEKPWNYTCYSFNGNKTLSTGSGGLVCSGGVERVRELADVGRKDGEFNSIGYNYRMNGIAAEMGLRQLPYLNKWVEKKRRFNQIYREQLSDIIQFQEPTLGSNPSWWFTAGLFPKCTDIQSLQNRLSVKGVPTRRIFQPLNQLKPYRSDKEFPVAEDIYNRGLCFPSSSMSTENDILRVCKTIRREFEQ